MFSEWFIEITDIVGLIGVTLTLLAYFLLQINRLSSESMAYSLMNLIGSGFVVYSLLFNWNTPALIMEGAWILISVWGVVKVLRR